MDGIELGIEDMANLTMQLERKRSPLPDWCRFAKQWYDTKGPFAGTFGLDPVELKDFELAVPNTNSWQASPKLLPPTLILTQTVTTTGCSQG